MVEIRVRRDEQGRIIPRCGECPSPHPDMRFKEDTPGYEIWRCPECGFIAEMRKPAPPKQVIIVDEFVKPN